MESFLNSGMEGNWSREQIASALRLVGAGVPLTRVLEMTGVSRRVFEAWKAEYEELFNRLVTSFSQQERPTSITKAGGLRRMAYMSYCAGDGDIESELVACKLRYSVVENAAVVACELLRSGMILGNFQRSIFPMTVPAVLVEKTDPGQIDSERGNLFIFVSAQIVGSACDPLQPKVSGDQFTHSGAVSGKIDELWMRKCFAEGGRRDEPIIQDVALKYSLEGIFDGPIDAIRAFYTSPLEALLLGNFLLQKPKDREAHWGGVSSSKTD